MYTAVFWFTANYIYQFSEAHDQFVYFFIWKFSHIIWIQTYSFLQRCFSLTFSTHLVLTSVKHTTPLYIIIKIVSIRSSYCSSYILYLHSSAHSSVSLALCITVVSLYIFTFLLVHIIQKMTVNKQSNMSDTA